MMMAAGDAATGIRRDRTPDRGLRPARAKRPSGRRTIGSAGASITATVSPWIALPMGHGTPDTGASSRGLAKPACRPSQLVKGLLTPHALFSGTPARRLHPTVPGDTQPGETDWSESTAPVSSSQPVSTWAPVSLRRVSSGSAASAVSARHEIDGTGKDSAWSAHLSTCSARAGGRRRSHARSRSQQRRRLGAAPGVSVCQGVSYWDTVGRERSAEVAAFRFTSKHYSCAGPVVVVDRLAGTGGGEMLPMCVAQ